MEIESFCLKKYLCLLGVIMIISGVQIATVQGGVGACGDPDYPGIFVRLDNPRVFSFIMSVIDEPKIEGTIF